MKQEATGSTGYLKPLVFSCALFSHVKGQPKTIGGLPCHQAILYLV